MLLDRLGPEDVQDIDDDIDRRRAERGHIRPRPVRTGREDLDDVVVVSRAGPVELRAGEKIGDADAEGVGDGLNGPKRRGARLTGPQLGDVGIAEWIPQFVGAFGDPFGRVGNAVGIAGVFEEPTELVREPLLADRWSTIVVRGNVTWISGIGVAQEGPPK